MGNFSRIVPYIGQIGHGHTTGAPVDAGKDYYLLRDPTAVAINGSDYVYVVDSARHQVIVYAPDGTYAGNRPTSSSTTNAHISDPAGRLGNNYPNKGTSDDNFDNPRDIAISPMTGFIYVLDWGNKRVMVYNPDHTYNTKFTGEGGVKFKNPLGIAINATGFIYVIDRDGGRSAPHTVEVFHPNHTHSDTIGGMPGAAPSLDFPESIAINSTGHIFITGLKNDVRVFNPDPYICLYVRCGEY